MARLVETRTGRKAGARDRPAPKQGKDAWDRLSSLSAPMATVIIGVLGIYATSSFNRAESARQTQSQVASERIAKTEQLSKIMTYLSSEKVEQREFGYAMFAALGEEKLALRIMELKKDPAGRQVAKSLTGSSKPGVSDAAVATLNTIGPFAGAANIERRLTEPQRSKFQQLYFKTQGTRYDSVLDTGDDLLFGLTGDSMRDGGLSRLLALYCEKAGASRDLCAFRTRSPASLSASEREKLITAFKAAAATPLMQRAQNRIFDGRAGATANQIATEQGLKLPLSYVVVLDAVVHAGRRANEWSRKTSEALGGSPAAGVDEKAWIRQFLIIRREGTPQIAKKLIDPYDALVAKGDWNLEN